MLHHKRNRLTSKRETKKDTEKTKARKDEHKKQRDLVQDTFFNQVKFSFHVYKRTHERHCYCPHPGCVVFNPSLILLAQEPLSCARPDQRISQERIILHLKSIIAIGSLVIYCTGATPASLSHLPMKVGAQNISVAFFSMY